jgi:hypothetical protein
MQFMMKADRKYHMSVEEIEQLIIISEQSGYRFDFVLTGGEPLLWNHLAALKELKKSKITNSIIMFSNAMPHERLTDDVATCLDSIRISHYFYNDKQMAELKARYPNKVVMVERTQFWKNPDDPVPNSLPCECMNPEILLYNYQVYACPHSLSIAQHNGSKVILSNPLKKGFMSGLADIKKNQAAEICTMCISNRKIRTIAESVANTSKGRELIQLNIKKKIPM